MKCHLNIIFLALLSMLLLSPLQSKAGETFDHVSEAKKLIGLLAGEQYADVFGMFDDKMKKGLPQDKIESVWKSIIAQAGGFKETGNVSQQKSGEYLMVLVSCLFEKTSLDATVAFDGDNKVAGLHFNPSIPPGKEPAKE